MLLLDNPGQPRPDREREPVANEKKSSADRMHVPSMAWICQTAGMVDTLQSVT